MLSRAESRKKTGENSGNAKFLSDLETLNSALYADKRLPRLASSTASSRSKSVGKSHLPEPKPKPKPKDVKNSKKDTQEKDGKSSIWSWRGLKALTHVRNRRFNCCFSLLVHSIEGLPVFLDNICLVVHWKRRDGEQMTRPVRVCQGVAEFEEQLTHSCSVYGSRSGPHHSAKYEAKHFLLYASVHDAPEIDLGKHRIDLTRFLPLTLEELEEEKTSGNWTTSFGLSGKAKGAKINVSFGYVVIGNNMTELSSSNSVSRIPSFSQNGETGRFRGQFDRGEEPSIGRAGSLPARSPTSTLSVEDIKDLHEVLPLSRSELCDSVNILYQKLDEDLSKASIEDELGADPVASPIEDQKVVSVALDDAGEKHCETDYENNEFSVVEKGIEELAIDPVKSEDESLKVAEDSVANLETDTAIGVTKDEDDPTKHPSPEESLPQIDEQSICAFITEEKDDVCSKEELMKELETALSRASNLVNEGLDSQDENDGLSQENYMDLKSDYRNGRKGKSLSLDDVTDLVASEFLDMLGIEHSPVGLSSESEPESPRERLLRQFEKDALATGDLFNFEIDNDFSELVSDEPTGSNWESISDDFLHTPIKKGLGDMPKIDIDALRATRASMVEDMETEALMHEWGLNEKAFQYSPSSSSGGFGSPINIPPEEPQLLPPIAEGLGHFVQTENGGFLRSMNPSIFRNSKSGGSLIMQVSNPVVVPAEMGSGVMDILQGLASVGIEKLSMQANKLMPLEEITGNTILQMAWEAAPSLEGPEREGVLQQETDLVKNIPREQKSGKGKSSDPTSTKYGTSSLSKDPEYVSLEDLAPLAMDKIEALSVEGLRIQSGMSDNDAPSNISAQSIGEFSALKGKNVDIGGSIGLDGTCGLQLLDIKDNGEDIDGLMGLSLTLDEWMKLDSGEINDDDLVSERTSKILAAHHATSLDTFRGMSKGEKRRSKGRKYGLLGNNFTVALMVQLRDPLRNYEAVGTPMLALIQVERVFIPPKPKMYSTVSLFRNSEKEEKEIKAAEKEDTVENPKEEKVNEEELIPQYKITEVHVAGLKTEPGKKKLWGSSAASSQQQSGSRWLLANGMGKKNKHPLMKPKVAVGKSSNHGSSSSQPAITATVQPGDTLWSISSRVYGTETKWKELAALNPHIRNPNVIFPNDTIRLK